MTGRRSPLHETHERAGATFTEFAGWRMPLRYTSELAEHHAVRDAAGLFDVSHMAKFTVTGPGAAASLDHALTADVGTLGLSRARYSMIVAEDGGIVDDLVVYQHAPGEYLIVANAGNHDVVAAELRERLGGFEVRLDDATDRLALIAVQGPASRRVLERTAGLEHRDDGPPGRTLETLPSYACIGMLFDGDALLVARTGYTGEDGFELYAEVAAAPRLWDAIRAAGADLGLVPAGLAARDTLRLEAGMPLYGQELGRGVQPAQAGLGRVGLPPQKRVDFVGRAALETGPADGARTLVGLVSEGRRAARTGYSVLAGETVVGEVTSGALSPTLGHPIGLAYVDPAHAVPGTTLDADVRGSRIPATVVPLPFYSRQESS